MASNTPRRTTAHHTDSDAAIGIAHLTVVPTNFDPETARSESEESPP
ncbi:hypothetical protein OB905_00180 [Halobacteria archaeon AArc-dxtr1]|nr:hypothetical protein [Halobacteria archaeon AArc-dxtr1]